MESLKSFFLRLPVRIAVSAAAPLLVAAGLFLLAKGYINVPCLFHEFTGLWCPGCGTGRAFRAIVNLDFISAFGYNPLVCLIGPFLFYYLVKMWLYYLTRHDILPFFRVTPASGVAVLLAFLFFWILRNIPLFPFTLLAP